MQPHEVIALLETRMHSQTTVPELLESMREKAKELGADAIIEIEQDEVVSQQQLVRDIWWGGYQTGRRGTDSDLAREGDQVPAALAVAQL